jgi:hypothetical protein
MSKACSQGNTSAPRLRTRTRPCRTRPRCRSGRSAARACRLPGCIRLGCTRCRRRSPRKRSLLFHMCRSLSRPGTRRRLGPSSLRSKLLASTCRWDTKGRWAPACARRFPAHKHPSCTGRRRRGTRMQRRFLYLLPLPPHRAPYRGGRLGGWPRVWRRPLRSLRLERTRRSRRRAEPRVPSRCPRNKPHSTPRREAGRRPPLSGGMRR